MQCSCCREQRDSLREYSISALDANQRKTILTLQLCALCRILYRIKPHVVRSRIAMASAFELRQRVA
jgi:hypothetical protein